MSSSRQLKRQLNRANGGRGARASSARPRTRSPEERLNRILLIGGSGLAIGAVLVALMARRFDAGSLIINLVAIGLGLLMGKGIGKFVFRHGRNPATLSNRK
jgi:hypothetical protein